MNLVRPRETPQDHMLPASSSAGAYGIQTDDTTGIRYGTDDAPQGGAGKTRSPRPRRVRRRSGLQRQAWQWALAHRSPDGSLPTGKAIAERFGRGVRWGRLVKQSGHLNDLGSPEVLKGQGSKTPQSE